MKQAFIPYETPEKLAKRKADIRYDHLTPFSYSILLLCALGACLVTLSLSCHFGGFSSHFGGFSGHFGVVYAVFSSFLVVELCLRNVRGDPSILRALWHRAEAPNHWKLPWEKSSRCMTFRGEGDWSPKMSALCKFVSRLAFLNRICLPQLEKTPDCLFSSTISLRLRCVVSLPF